jgi:ActR/RegA family two-component response regulator
MDLGARIQKAVFRGARSRQVDQKSCIFITGYGDISMSVKAMRAGAVEFLTKPFREQDLLDAVRPQSPAAQLSNPETGISNLILRVWLILESILHVGVSKIVLQHNTAESGQPRTDVNDPLLIFQRSEVAHRLVEGG